MSWTRKLALFCVCDKPPKSADCLPSLSRRSATVLDDDGMIIGLHDFGHARRLSREQTEQWQALGDVQCREILPTRLNFAEMTDITFMNRLYDYPRGHSIDF